MDSTVKETLTALGRVMLEAPKKYEHYISDSHHLFLDGEKVQKISVEDLYAKTNQIKANAIGHIPIIFPEEYPKGEVKVADLVPKHLYGLNRTDIRWITEASSPREAGIACLYLVLRGVPPMEFSSRPALARKKAREVLKL